MHWSTASVFLMIDSMDKTIASYAAFLGLFVLLTAIVLPRFRKSLPSYLVVWTIYPLAFLWLAFFMARDIFDALNMSAMGVFLGGTLMLALCAYLAWPTYKKFAAVFGFCAITLAVIGTDAFIIEPHWLEVRHETVASNKIAQPMRILVLSDLQTDRVGGFERDVLQRLMNEHPDMILLPGDYIQANRQEHEEEVAKLRKILSELKVTAPLGVYATQGDAERSDWTTIFAGLPITVFPESGTIEHEKFALTALTLKDSFKLDYKIPHKNKFHIVVGHRPDFVTSAPEGDLLVAGHTHGGQVQLPFWGPLLTFSGAPRKWCGGCNVVQDNGTSVVITRGVGMERGLAPRLRFFCRPEIVVIDVKPSGDKSIVRDR